MKKRKITAPYGRTYFIIIPKLNFDAFTIDFLPELPGLSKFRNSYENKEIARVEGVDIMFINFDDLITNKKAVAREKDITDLNELKKRRNNDLEQ